MLQTLQLYAGTAPKGKIQGDFVETKFILKTISPDYIAH